MLSIETEMEYKTFEGFSLEKQKTVWNILVHQKFQLIHLYA